MLVQDLYRATSDETWVTIITDGTVISLRYNGLLTNIPVSLLDTHIKGMSAIDFNHLVITIA